MARRAVSAYVGASERRRALAARVEQHDRGVEPAPVHRAAGDERLRPRGQPQGLDDDVRYQRRRAIAARELAEEKRPSRRPGPNRSRKPAPSSSSSPARCSSASTTRSPSPSASPRPTVTSPAGSPSNRPSSPPGSPSSEKPPARRRRPPPLAPRLRSGRRRAAAPEAVQATLDARAASDQQQQQHDQHDRRADSDPNGSESAPAVSSGPSYSSGGISLDARSAASRSTARSPASSARC